MYVFSGNHFLVVKYRTVISENQAPLLLPTGPTLLPLRNVQSEAGGVITVSVTLVLYKHC